ncbi:GntR family transcriptional regulator [Pseudooceanicola sp. C21-150M6]|uniref:GntR family transcriptional regulator n=1 Tax=Pseudooceanicola sp. C21-150M6 TaxID=3434355 RepID=UPI003D7F9F5D
MLFRREDEEETVVSLLAATLRRDIAFGVLSPNQKLKIEDLRRRYGGSGHSMRETLRTLTAEGLVEATAQRGFRVTSATEDDLRDICLMRQEVESVALRLSMERADLAWEGRILAARHALSRLDLAVADQADDLTALEWDESCRAFSAALCSACGSPRLIDLQRKFFDQGRRFRLALLREGRIDFAAREDRQAQLVSAILARDTDLALHCLREDLTIEMTGGS